MDNREKQLIEKTEEINGAISKLWRETGALKRQNVQFYDSKSIRKAKDGILFIGKIHGSKHKRALLGLIKKNPQLEDYRKRFFSQMGSLARYAKCESKWAYVDFNLGLRAKCRKFLAAKTLQEKAIANKRFVEKVEDLSLDLIIAAIRVLKPRSIVVFNLMSTLLDEKVQGKHLFAISNRVFEQAGFPLFDDEIPLFFCISLNEWSSDNGSFARLKWHVKKAIVWAGKRKQSLG